MQILYDSGYNEEQRRDWRIDVIANIVSGIRYLLDAIEDMHLQLDDYIKERVIEFIETESFKNFIFERQHIITLDSFWNSPVVQQACEQGFSKHYDFTFPHFFNSIERIAARDYIPTHQDILYVRIKTTGIVELEYTIDGVPYHMFDTGGERSERKKWIHTFEDVTAVIYVASLSGYSFTIYEDQTTNSMLEFITLFRELCNAKQLSSSPMIVFLNKRDLFLERLKVAPLRMSFPDYTGPNEYDACIKFISNKFLAENKNNNRKIHIHVICAINTDEVAQVFNNIKTIILGSARIL